MRACVNGFGLCHRWRMQQCRQTDLLQGVVNDAIDPLPLATNRAVGFYLA